MPKPKTGPRKPADLRGDVSPIDRYVESLIKVYGDAQRQLDAVVRQTLASDALGSHAYLTRQLRIVDLILSQLRVEQQNRIYTGVANVFQATSKAAFNAGSMGTHFGGVNQRAVQILATAMNQRVDGALTIVGRRIDDAFRRAALDKIAEGVASSDTRRNVSRSLERKLLEDKITDATTGFVDRSGARWSLESYTRMVARTTTREAMTSAVVDQIQRSQTDDLIQISEHAGAADICSLYEGRTFSLFGKTPGYDVIDQLPPFHPNCVHVAFPGGAAFDEFERELGLALV